MRDGSTSGTIRQTVRILRELVLLAVLAALTAAVFVGGHLLILTTFSWALGA